MYTDYKYHKTKRCETCNHGSIYKSEYSSVIACKKDNDTHAKKEGCVLWVKKK